MSSHILALDIAGAPHRWINVRDAAAPWSAEELPAALGRMKSAGGGSPPLAARILMSAMSVHRSRG